eukprot:g16850.t1
MQEAAQVRPLRRRSAARAGLVRSSRPARTCPVEAQAVAQKRLMTRLARLLTRWDASHRRGVRIMAGLQKAAARESAQEKQKEAQAAQQALRQKRAAEAEARSLERAAAKRQREEHRNRWKWLNRKDITMEELLHSKGCHVEASFSEGSVPDPQRLRRTLLNPETWKPTNVRKRLGRSLAPTGGGPPTVKADEWRPLGRWRCHEARGELPPPGDVRDALELPGSGFTVTGNLNVGRCVVVRGLLARDVGGRGTPRSFVEQRQASLDQRYGAGKYVVLLQRERPPPAPGLSLWPKGQFDPAKCSAALLVFRASDLPIEDSSNNFRRLLIGASLAATASFCNIIAAAVTYSPMLGVAVTRLDADGVVPVGVGLFLMLFAQGFARKQVAELNDAKIRGGYFIPSSSLGTLGRTWGFAGLAPSRRTEIDVTLAGSYAGLCGALALCLLGVLRGDASDGLLLVEVTRLPLLLAQALGDSFPDDAVRTVLSLSSGEAAASAPAKVTVDPLLLSGSLALTSQAVQLLPLRGCDGHLLARFLFGPRPLQFIELCTGVLLLLGAVGRLGPNANATVCSSALFGWAARFLASRRSPLPPREDFDDEPWASPTAAAAAALALAAAGAILIPGARGSERCFGGVAREKVEHPMVWARTLQPLRCCRHLLKRQLCRAAPRGKVHGKAFFPLGAGGVSFFLSKGHLLLDEEEDEAQEEDFSAHSWNKCQPEPFASGAQVFVWGHHACWPVCEAAEAARAPETGIHAPTEAAWFRQYAEQNNCKWQQLSFGPSFGASRTDTGDAQREGSQFQQAVQGFVQQLREFSKLLDWEKEHEEAQEESQKRLEELRKNAKLREEAVKSEIAKTEKELEDVKKQEQRSQEKRRESEKLEEELREARRRRDEAERQQREAQERAEAERRRTSWSFSARGDPIICPENTDGDIAEEFCVEYKGPATVTCFDHRGKLQSLDFVGVCDEDGNNCQSPEATWVGEQWRFDVASREESLPTPSNPSVVQLRALLEARAEKECVTYDEATELMLRSTQCESTVLAQYYARASTAGREGYYNKAQTICDQEARRSNDVALHLWKAYALHCEGSTREAILEAEACVGKRDMGLPFASALAYFHEQLATVDQDAVRDMNLRRSQQLPSAPEASRARVAQRCDDGRVLTVRFYTMVGEVEKAQEVLSSMDGLDSPAVNAARGWNGFVAGKKANAASGKTSIGFLDQCGQYFDGAIGTGAELDNLDALMGKAKVLEGKRQWVQALDALNKVIVMHDWFLPALIEKAKALMMTADWDQALEAAGRLQQQDAWAQRNESPDLAFLQSLIAWRKRRDAEGALNLLNETLTLHITNFKSAVGYDFFIKLNADFMLEIAREYLQHTISGGGDDAAKPGGYLLRGVQVLETLTRFVPGLVPAQVLLAKAKVALNEVDVATRILHQCLRLDPSSADTHLLLARIYHQKDRWSKPPSYWIPPWLYLE